MFQRVRDFRPDSRRVRPRAHRASRTWRASCNDRSTANAAHCASATSGSGCRGSANPEGAATCTAASAVAASPSSSAPRLAEVARIPGRRPCESSCEAASGATTTPTGSSLFPSEMEFESRVLPLSQTAIWF